MKHSSRIQGSHMAMLERDQKYHLSMSYKIKTNKSWGFLQFQVFQQKAETAI